MTDEASESTKKQLEEVADNAGARAAATDSNPKISLQEGENAAAGEGPNASGSIAPSSAEWHVPSTSDPNPTDLPTANAPSSGSESTDEAISGSTNQKG